MGEWNGEAICPPVVMWVKNMLPLCKVPVEGETSEAKINKAPTTG